MKYPRLGAATMNYIAAELFHTAHGGHVYQASAAIKAFTDLKMCQIETSDGGISCVFDEADILNPSYYSGSDKVYHAYVPERGTVGVVFATGEDNALWHFAEAGVLDDYAESTGPLFTGLNHYGYRLPTGFKLTELPFPEPVPFVLLFNLAVVMQQSKEGE